MNSGIDWWHSRNVHAPAIVTKPMSKIKASATSINNTMAIKARGEWNFSYSPNENLLDFRALYYNSLLQRTQPGQCSIDFLNTFLHYAITNLFTVYKNNARKQTNLEKFCRRRIVLTVSKLRLSRIVTVLVGTIIFSLFSAYSFNLRSDAETLAPTQSQKNSTHYQLFNCSLQRYS